MQKDQNRRTKISHTPEDRARHRAIRDQFRKKPSLGELLASGEIDVATFDKAIRLQQAGPPAVDPDTLAEIGEALRQERERAGLSLAEVTQRSGIDAPALSRLENGQNPNPTLATLSRYAQALGKRFHWSLETSKTPGSAEI
jgi:ribosome-binding protein aMBF1 (putative translation factor)